MIFCGCQFTVTYKNKVKLYATEKNLINLLNFVNANINALVNKEIESAECSVYRHSFIYTVAFPF